MKEELAVFDQTTAGIIMAVNRFSPRTKDGKVISSSKNFWRQPAYYHEKVVVSVWACLAERMAEKGISRSDAEDFIKVAEWLYYLKIEQIEAEKPSNREDYPPLFSLTGRVVVERILNGVADREKFFNRNDWQKVIMASARGLAMALDSIFLISVLDGEKKIAAEAKVNG